MIFIKPFLILICSLQLSNHKVRSTYTPSLAVVNRLEVQEETRLSLFSSERGPTTF